MPDPKIGPGNEFLVDKDRNLVYQIKSDGSRFYYSPASITPAQLAESQAGVPHDPANYFDTSTIPDNSLLHERGQWDPQSGKFETPINWTNLASLGVGGMIAAPLIAPLLTGAAAPGAGGGVGLGETASTYGLASGAGIPGAAGIPTAAGIGAGAGTGVGVGETASSWGLGSGAGLPGATAAPAATGIGAAAPVGLAPGSTAAETSSALGGKMGLGSILSGIAKNYGGGGNSWIPQAIQAGTNLAQGYLGSRAANKAAEQQIAATNQAKQELGGIYQQQQALQAPWISSGMASLGALNKGLGLNPQPVPGFPAGAGGATPQPGMMPARPDRQGTIVDQAMPRASVMLRAPDGSTQSVPGDQVAHYLAKGAVRA